MTKEIEKKYEWNNPANVQEFIIPTILFAKTSGLASQHCFDRRVHYFDTKDLDLYKTGSTCRLVEGFDDGHYRADYKTGTGLQREEFQVTSDKPDALEKLIEIYNLKPMTKIVSTTKKYQRVMLYTPQWTYMVEGVHVLANNTRLFSELEIELVEGEAKPFLDYCKVMEQFFGLTQKYEQKYTQVLKSIKGVQN